MVKPLISFLHTEFVVTLVDKNWKSDKGRPLSWQAIPVAEKNLVIECEFSWKRIDYHCSSSFYPICNCAIADIKTAMSRSYLSVV